MNGPAARLSPLCDDGAHPHQPCVTEDVLPKTYDPVGTEARWQQAWESSGAFHPDAAAPGEP